MTAADLALVVGLLGAACVFAAIAAHRIQQSRRDVRLMLGTGGVLGVTALVLQFV